MSEVTFRSDMGVDLVQFMGSDEMVARAARVSTGKDQLEQGKIKGLINYLVREGHTSTLEHCVLTVRVEAPLFVRDQWVRHRTQSVNIESARYSKMKPVFYVPSKERPLVNAGSGAHPDLVQDSRFYDEVETAHENVAWKAWYEYESLVDSGVATEVARNVLPVSLYTSFYATANLNNWFKFLWLRNGENGHPQYEIVQVAKKVEAIIADLYPLSYKAWRETITQEPSQP